MACLIISTSTVTVNAASYWGTLKAGDEMRWDSSEKGTYTIKIIEIDGKLITAERNGKISQFDPEGFDGPEALYPWIYPAENLGGSTQDYEFEGTSYRAYYSKTESDEVWRDVDTGILFEWRTLEADDTFSVYIKLTYSTADMAVSTGSYGSGTGGCLGTILITLFSVTTMVSYSVWWKKKKL